MRPGRRQRKEHLLPVLQGSEEKQPQDQKPELHVSPAASQTLTAFPARAESGPWGFMGNTAKPTGGGPCWNHQQS